MRFLFVLIWLPAVAFAHPGIGIVADSHGNIFYNDLQQVWKITGNTKTLAVPDVHSHELFMDAADNLYGEQLSYEPTSQKFYHYLWRHTAKGTFEIIITRKEAYITIDYSLARDKNGFEYYTKFDDTTHIFFRYPGKAEKIFSTGHYKRITWLHPQKDGSILLVRQNAIIRVLPGGTEIVVAKKIANDKPSFSFSKDSKTVWGLWTDEQGNIYAAAFSDQAVKKINPDGSISVYYKSKGNWAPIHGVFIGEQLWLMESSDKNEVRVTKINTSPGEVMDTNRLSIIPFIISALIGFMILYWMFLARNRKIDEYRNKDLRKSSMY